jgi:hypothetical protein
VIRGRLAEADILLACLVAWTLVAFDRAFCVGGTADGRAEAKGGSPRLAAARWAFFALLAASALVKGVGFGAVMIVTVAMAVLFWERDREKMRRFLFPAGWALAIVLTVAWPLWMVVEHGAGAIGLWAMHLTHRLVAQRGPGPFASEPWWQYVPDIIGQALPWSPWALVGAWQSLGRMWLRAWGISADGHGRGMSASAVASGDRLLWAWSAGPLILLSLAAVKNAHYTIAALVPWSVWAALALTRFGEKLRQAGWGPAVLRRGAWAGFASLAFAYGLVFGFLVPCFDRRGVEWGFYESAGQQIDPGMPLALLYDDWDRNAYDSAFGSIPHDLAVRLFYLRRAACWHNGASSLAAHVSAVELGRCALCRAKARGRDVADAAPSFFGAAGGSAIGGRPLAFAVIGRDRDLADLGRLGHVEVVAQGPSLRHDRTYTVFRITPERSVGDGAVPIASARGDDTPGAR